MIGFTATRGTLHTVATDRQPRGMGFSVGRVTGQPPAVDPVDSQTVYCSALQSRVTAGYAVQNTRGRFRRPGLVAPLTTH